jgi:hypothetical protein
LCFVGLSASGRFGFDEAEHRASAAVEWLSPRWAILAAVLFTVSLVIYPSWPIVWLRSTSPYQGSRPPLFVLPRGPLLLLALLRWRDRRSWFLFSMALMPWLGRVQLDQTIWRQAGLVSGLGAHQ